MNSAKSERKPDQPRKMSGNLSVVAFEGELNSIVKEYLDFGGFDGTLTEFERECRAKKKPVSHLDKRAHGDEKCIMAQNQMIEFFHEGKGDMFFKLWQDYLPPAVQNSDQVAQKLEFYLKIYFTVYPIKYNQPQAATEEAMADFKKFIETRGSKLSQTTEFLPFYALPFVPNPKTHPSYREMFTEAWSKDLVARVEKFLTLSLKSTIQPRLFDLYRGTRGDAKGEDRTQATYLQQQAVDAERKSLTYIRRFNKVQADYHSLIGITADLVDALESTVQGRPITPEYLQQLCNRLFTSHMRTSVDITRPGTAGEALRASVAPPQMPTKAEVEAFPPLDYSKVKSELQTTDDGQKALILQALRWRLTQSMTDKRDQIIADYVANDILGCSNTGPYRESIMQMLTSGTDEVKQYMARLYNAIASLCVGRGYLAMNPDLLPALMDILHNGEQRDLVAQEMVLGALQKLSLRRQLQTAMIERGVIEWLVSVLEDNDSLSDYTLEYSVALLMNLCLRTGGKKRCGANAHQTLQVLSDLLGHDNQEIRPYVNGALYSILAIPSIREEAKAMGMEEILRCFIKDDQPDMNRQIEFIIKQLNSSENGEDYESDDEEDDEEEEEDQDALEADLDKDEVVRPQPGELTGETLLTSQFSLTAPPGTSRGRKKTMDVSQQDQPLQRPVTPGQRRTGGNESVRETIASRLAASRAAVTPVAGSRPATGSKDMNARPPTRSGSRPATQESTGKYGVRPPSQQSERAQRPSTKAMEKLGPGANVKEYRTVFGSKPKIPRTPDPLGGSRPSTRGSVKDAPPQPQYSMSEPRPTSSGKSAPGSPRKGSVTGGSKPQTPQTPSYKPQTPQTPSVKPQTPISVKPQTPSR
ncbi:lisH domain-containing protein ARMC9-like isoform X2 [Littorina saxatilis]